MFALMGVEFFKKIVKAAYPKCSRMTRHAALHGSRRKALEAGKGSHLEPSKIP